MNQFFTIFKYEFNGIVRTKGYRLTTLILMIALALVLSWPSISGALDIQPGSAEAERQTLAMYNAGFGGLDDAALASALPQYNLVKYTSEQSVNDAVGNESAKVGLILDGPEKFRLVLKYGGFESSVTGQVQAELTRQYQDTELLKAGLTPDQAGAILNAQVVDETVELGKGFSNTFAYSYALLIILYIAIIIYGQMVATSVATEKSSRTMELLITSAKPTNLIFGKVLGSGCAGILQLLLVLVTASVFYNINAAGWGDSPIIKSLFGMPPDILAFAIIFFILGYFLYAFMYGALGSLVSRQEELQSSTMLITMLLVVAYIVSIQGAMDPGGAPVMIASFIPFTAPMAMFIRVSMTQVPIWELAVSMGLCLLMLVLIGWLAAKIYRVGVLMYGKPPKLKEVFKLMKNS